MSETAKVEIKGMHCGSCTYKIECEVGDLPGVEEAKVDLKSEIGTFKFDPKSATGTQQILDTITKLGFTAKLVFETHFSHSRNKGYNFF